MVMVQASPAQCSVLTRDDALKLLNHQCKALNSLKVNCVYLVSRLDLVGLVVGQLLLVEIHLVVLLVVVMARVVGQLGARYQVGVIVAVVGCYKAISIFQGHGLQLISRNIDRVRHFCMESSPCLCRVWCILWCCGL